MMKTKSKFEAHGVISSLTALALIGFAAPIGATDLFTGQSHNVIHQVPAPLSNTYSVGLNKTEIVRLPVSASAVLVGNPEIADVSIHSADTIFVIGRSYGETNIVVLDKAGHTILDANIQVKNALPRNGVRVFYGSSDRETYSCSPYCAAAPVLGDSPAFIGANSAASRNINNTIALGNTQQPTADLSQLTGDSRSSDTTE